MGANENILTIPLRPETSVYVSGGEACIHQSGQYDSATVRLTADELRSVRDALNKAQTQLDTKEGRSNG